MSEGARDRFARRLASPDSPAGYREKSIVKNEKNKAKRDKDLMRTPAIRQAVLKADPLMPIALAIKNKQTITRSMVRDQIFHTIGRLSSLGPMTPGVAKEIFNGIGKAWLGERTALEYHAMRKEKPPRQRFIEG